VGVPVSGGTARTLELAMEKSIALQPYVRSIEVSINRKMLEENAFGYCELGGNMITAEVEIGYQNETVRARIEHDQKLDYPLMRLL
jgi:dihydroneopterin aldolase